VIKLEEKVLGPEHPDTLGSRTNLAVALQSQGKYAEAETEFRAVLKLEEKVLGPEHPSTLGSRNNLANVLAGQGKYAEAEAEYREVIKLREKVLGPEHPNTLSSCFNLALCLKAENKTDEAKEFARRAAQGANKILGVNHPDVLKYAKVWQELQNNGASTGAPDSAPAQDIGTPAGASSADDVSSIPEKVVQGFSAPDVDALGSMYAGTVDYLDSGRISSAAVRNQLAEYFARWPVRQWEVVGPVKVESLGASVQQVVFSAKYDLSDPDSKRHASGIAKETLMIAPDSSGAMKIISHHETTKASSGSHSSSSKTSERRSDRQKVYKERLVIPQLPGVPWP
jgi:tetratricopeptide (TPR) repeat protein